MKKLVGYIKKNRLEVAILAIITLLAIFLRFYRISELHFFTYDQARDVLIAKRILVDHKWTLLGPQSSIGNIYFPPLYYYTLTLPLWIFGMNPVGTDIYTAFIGVLTVLLIFFVAKIFFSKRAGIFAASLYATSPIVVELSRRAWNPNTLPFFFLLALILGYQFWKSGKIKMLLAMSFVFGYALSLHYSVFCLFPVVICLWVDYFLKKKQVWPILVSFLIISLFFLPLLLFDFRHNFILSKNLVDYFLREGNYYFNKDYLSFLEASLASVYEIIVVPLSGYFLKGVSGTAAPYEFTGRIKDVFFQFAPVSIIAHKPLIIKYYWWGQIIFFIIFIFSLARIFFTSLKDKTLAFLWFWFIVAIITSRFHQKTVYFFYYLFLYPIPFLLWAAFLNWTFKKGRFLKILVSLSLLIMVGINFRQSLMYETTGRTLEDIKAVARIISQDVGKEQFNLAASYKDPDRWDHHALDYRYFVEAFYHKKPLDWYPENYRQSQTLYFISEGKIEKPLESEIMEVREFGPQKLVKSWSYKDEIFIYKLAKD